MCQSLERIECMSVWQLGWRLGLLEPVRTGVKVRVSVGVGVLVWLGMEVPVSDAVSEGR